MSSPAPSPLPPSPSEVGDNAVAAAAGLDATASPMPASPAPADGSGFASSGDATRADDLARWLGLVLTPDLGTRGIHHLLRGIGPPNAIAQASLTTLEACGIRAAAAQFLHAGRSWEAGFRELEKVRAQGIELITLHDARYPLRLREIYDPPPLLYVRGAAEALDRFAIAVVGTRRPTPYGKYMAERLGWGLSQWGLVVVSGLARGIDGMAQRACIEAGGVSVAVLGTGADVVYPKEHEKLAAQLLAGGGAIVSEFPLATYPAQQNFPIRNRVISGLSLGVVVVEGGEYSGSRITARLALEQDREVFGVAGLATNRQAWVPNTLIKQGAKLVTDAADVVEQLPFEVRQRLLPPAATDRPAPASNGGDAAPHAGLLAHIRAGEAVQVDQLAELLQDKMTLPEVLAALLELELAGKVQQLPGKNYTRVE